MKKKLLLGHWHEGKWHEAGEIVEFGEDPGMIERLAAKGVVEGEKPVTTKRGNGSTD